jgi:hypothetical protein
MSANTRKEEIYDKLNETLKHYDALNIQVLPLEKITLDNNKKKAFAGSIPHGWRNKKNTLAENLECLNNGVCGFMTKTGANSGIFAVDYDNKPTTNSEILKILKDADTLTVETPNGGYHFIFKYTELMASNRTGIYGNIDIRGENGILYMGERNEGHYNILEYKNIKSCPTNILNLLLSYHNVISKKDILNAPVVSYISNDDIENKDFKYTLNDKQILKILDLLNPDYNNEYSKWFIISSILKKSGYREAWDMWSSKNILKYDKEQNEKYWEKLPTDKTTADFNHIINIINTSANGGDKIKVLSKIYMDYEPLTKTENMQDINHKYLTIDLINPNRDIIFKSGLGTGKTTCTFDYVIKNNIPILSICSLVSVVNSHIEKYNEQKGKENMDLLKYNDEDLNDKYFTMKKENKISGIVSTIDSIIKIKMLIGEDIKKYVVFIDEFHSVLQYLLTSSTLKNKRRQVFASIGWILKHCKQIIGADGDICDNVMQFMELLQRKEKPIFIYNKYKSFDNIPCKFINDENDIYKKICDILEHNKDKEPTEKIGFTVCCNTKSRVDKLKAYFNIHNLSNEYFKYYTSTEGEQIENIENEWSKNAVIYSPSIVAGLDFTPKESQPVFVFIDGDATINPEQVGQQICRNRNIKEVFIYICKMKNNLLYKSIDDVKEFYTTTEGHFNAIFRELVDIKSSIYDIEYTDNDFTKLFYEYQYQNNILLSSYEYNLAELLKNKGFNIDDETAIFQTIKLNISKAENIKITDTIKETNTALYKSYINNEPTKNEKYILLLNKRLEYFELPLPSYEIYKEDKTHKIFLEENEDVFNDAEAFNKYFNIALILDKNDNINKRFSNDLKSEYIENLYKSAVPLVKGYLNIIDKYLKNDIEPLAFSFDDGDDKLNEKIEMDACDYGYIKSVIRTTKKQPKNKLELLRMMIFIIADIFGRDLLRTERYKTKDRKQHTKYIWNDTIYNKYEKLYNEKQKKYESKTTKQEEPKQEEKTKAKPKPKATKKELTEEEREKIQIDKERKRIIQIKLNEDLKNHIQNTKI